MGIKKISTVAEFNKIIESGKPTIFDFYADWCGPCKKIAPEIEKLSAKHGDVNFCKVNVEEAATLAEKMRINAMPTFLFYNNGKLIKKFAGADLNKFKLALNDIL